MNKLKRILRIRLYIIIYIAALGSCDLPATLPTITDNSEKLKVLPLDWNRTDTPKAYRCIEPPIEGNRPVEHKLDFSKYKSKVELVPPPKADTQAQETKKNNDNSDKQQKDDDKKYEDIEKMKVKCQEMKKLAADQMKSAASIKTRQAYFAAKAEIEKLITETDNLQKEALSKLQYGITEIQDCLDCLIQERQTIIIKLITHALKKSNSIYEDYKSGNKSLNSAKGDVLSLVNESIRLYNEGGAYNAKMLKDISELKATLNKLDSIDPKEDAYAVLGLKNGATKEEIKKAYRNLVMKCHPDKGGSQEDFRKIQEAYELLQKA
jgi:hypothetical protein